MFFKAILSFVMFLGTSNFVYGKDCSLNIEGNDAMQFNTKTMTVEAGCKTVTVNLKHTGKLPKQAMGHNWILVKTADLTKATAAAIKAGLGKEYAPGNDVAIAATKLIGGGESASVKFDASKIRKGEDYTYFCGFPGHSGLMKGKLVVK